MTIIKGKKDKSIHLYLHARSLSPKDKKTKVICKAIPAYHFCFLPYFFPNYNTYWFISKE